MKLFGHPVHPLFIHFPTALFPADLVLSYLYYSTGNHSFYLAGVYCLMGGASTGILALLSGLLDLFSIPKDDKKAIVLALYHGFLNGSLVLIFAVIAFKEWQALPTPVFAGVIGLLTKTLLVLLLFIGNYLGGRLIYEYFIGINIKIETNGKLTH